MDRHKYKVEILHYLNPHLMWVLIDEDKGENNFQFEQIGIYGVLPLDVSFDIGGIVTTTKCAKWQQAVYLAMSNIFLEATEIWFSATFLDKTTSIFDDNVHKYGDLTLKLKNGSTISMLQKLLETNFMAEDVRYFHQNLANKLDYITTVSVINTIKNRLQHKPGNLIEIFKKQTSICHQMMELECLNPRNLDMRARENIQERIRKQIDDLNACKDVDEVSAGRASNIKSINGDKTNLTSGILRKLELMNSMSRSPSTVKTPSVSGITSRQGSSDTSLDINQNETQSQYVESQKARVMNNNKGAIQKTKEVNKKLIAMGPPGMNPTKYTVKLKEIPKEPEEKVTAKTEIQHSKKTSETYEKADSEVSTRSFCASKLRHIAENMNKSLKNNNENSAKKVSVEEIKSNKVSRPKSSLQRRMQFIEERMSRSINDSSDTSYATQGDDSDTESITDLISKLDVSPVQKCVNEPELVVEDIKHDVNPFKNLDGSKSVFVEKLVRPTLMVHTKNGNRIQPVSNIRDVPFGTNIHLMLRNMSIKKPMRSQTVSWPVILRGHSLFLVGQNGCGKTLGYLPAVCRLVSDYKKSIENLSVTHLSCIIICGTAKSVQHIQALCKTFLHEAKIFACYTGMTDININTILLNGCDILICTPKMLVRIMRHDLGLDIRHFNTFVIDDCERISEVYPNELKYCLFKIKEMLKIRANKELKVQYVVASRIWCGLMSSLARKAPDSVICIGAFQECVLYSEANTSVAFLHKDKKLNAVVSFLKEIDNSKKTVIACRTDEEVHMIEEILTDLKYVVFACDSTMTVQDLYKIDLALSDYQEPLLGPILVCCDGNLDHLNLTDAHYLIHFSLPELFSKFCKRFSVLIDNYSSIFSSEKSDIRIKIFIENTNVEQLPKILHFIKRCSDNLPAILEETCTAILLEKDLKKAQNFVSLCDTLMTMGHCPDAWSCIHRHSIFQKYDKPKDWVPKEGEITFKILHYHSAVHYSAKLLTCSTKNGVHKYSQTYSMLSVKLGMYYCKENNRKLHGVGKPGDLCAVSLKQNLFVRCQIMKILSYTRNNHPSVFLINLIDEEKYEIAKDTCLYHLPDDLKKIETQVVRIILSNIMPEDKDITYSSLAENHIKSITENNDDVFMRGQVKLVIENCIFVDTIEACQNLASVNEIVVKSNFKNELLGGYAVENPDHIAKLQELGKNVDFMRQKEVETTNLVIPKPIKMVPKVTWAYLESDTDVPIYYLFAKSPTQFFVQHVKFQDCLKILLKDIKKYVSEHPEPAIDLAVGDIVLAEFPDNPGYERARIDSIIDDGNVNCFFVDLGDWRDVSTDKLLTMPEQIVTQLPFQAIECRLTGIKCSEEKLDQATDWLIDQFYDSSDNLKYLYAKRFTKEKAEFTGGNKYGIVLIDSYDNDVYINKLMIDVKMAELNDEIGFFQIMNKQKDSLDSVDTKNSVFSKTDIIESENMVNVPDVTIENNEKQSNTLSLNNSIEECDTADDVSSFSNSIGEITSNLEPSKSNMIAEYDRTSPKSKEIDNIEKPRGQFIRSVPLVQEDEDIDKWDLVNFDGSMLGLKKNYTDYLSTVKDTKNGENQQINVASTSKIDLDTTSNAKVDDQEIISNKSKSSTVDDVKLATYNIPCTNKDNISPNLAPPSSKINGDEIETVSSKSETNEINSVTSKSKVAEFINTQSTTKTNFEEEIVTSNSKYKVDEIKTSITKFIELNNSPRSSTVSSPELINSISKDIIETQKSKYYVPTKSVDNISNSEKSDQKYKKPKLIWRQDKNNVFIKIKLTTNDYDLIIENKNIKFYADENTVEYAFDFELNGVVDVKKSTHSYKKDCVQIELKKLLNKYWLSLNKGSSKKWIVYDTDSSDNDSEKSVKKQNIDTQIIEKPNIEKQNTDKLETEKLNIDILNINEKNSRKHFSKEPIIQKQNAKETDTRKQNKDIQNSENELSDKSKVKKQKSKKHKTEKESVIQNSENQHLEKLNTEQLDTKLNSLLTNEYDTEFRKPRTVWRQVNSAVIIKILIITEKYDLEIKNKHLKFYSNANDTQYGFEIELYGVVDVKKSRHCNKGQYIQINLHKILNKKWFYLSKSLLKWISYDVDDLNASSDEDNLTIGADDLKNDIESRAKLNSDTDDDFDDDTRFNMRR